MIENLQIAIDEADLWKLIVLGAVAIFSVAFFPHTSTIAYSPFQLSAFFGFYFPRSFNSQKRFQR
jgi:hypothetical protein